MKKFIIILLMIVVAISANAIEKDTISISQTQITKIVTDTGVSSNGKGATSEKESSTEGLATSADIDRLIEVIKTLNQNQNDQKDFLRALAGKNTFTYSM